MLKAPDSVENAAAVATESGDVRTALEDENKKVLAKVTRNIVPLLWLIFFFSLLSRINLTNMHVVLTQQLELSEYQYGGAVGAFYLAFVVFPIPANLILERMRMNVWMSILMCLWGIVTMLSVFVSDAASLITVRFCLGLTEAGLSPGVIYYITTWFSERYRVKQISLIQTSIPFGYAVSGIMSSIVLDHLDGVLGLRGWKWLCIITGFPSIVVSVLFYFFLPNSPSDARFLNTREREVVISSRMLTASTWVPAQRTTPGRLIISTLAIPKNWIFSFCGMFIFATLAGINGFIPALLYEAGSPLFVSNLLIAVPNCAAIVTLVMWSRHSDKVQERFWHIFIAFFLALLALGTCIMFVYYASLALVVVLLSVYQSCLVAGYCIFIAEMLGSLTGSLSIGIAMYYTVLGFGGWFGPFMMGYTRDLTGDHVVGLAFMCSSIAFAIALLSVCHYTSRSTKAENGSQMRLQYETDSQQTTEGARYQPRQGSMGGAAILV